MGSERAIFAPMTDLELSRALRTLRRTVQMMETEL
jgi:hypothetical protein